MKVWKYFLVVLVMACLSSCENKEKTEVVNKIEDTYFRLGNGFVGKEEQEFPLYNMSVDTRALLMGSAILVLTDDFEVEAREIDVLEIREKEVDVQYQLFAKLKDKEKTVAVEMTLKKIGGNWKLDGEKFFPMEMLDYLKSVISK